MSSLVLVRHGQSQWNLENRFTGWVDVPLSDQGIKEAKAAGQKIQSLGVVFDFAHTSRLQRAQKTLDLILEVLGQKMPRWEDSALNERFYGDLQGLNKDETRQKFGEEQVHLWRRSFDIAPPNGESLKDTSRRTIPYFNHYVLPALKEGKNVLIAAHGNSLRSIIMAIENLSPEEILKRELATGDPLVYEMSATGLRQNK